jgi:hypothetical protein
MQTDELLKTALMDVLAHCLDKGMRMPLMVCMMSPNGSVIAIRCLPDSDEPEVLVEHNEGDRFVRPIGVLVLDQSGQALKFIVDRGGVKPESPIGRSRSQ